MAETLAANEVLEAKAIAKTVRIAPRKVRLVVDLIRGKKVSEAEAILRLTNKRSAAAVAKVLNSAIANAENNYDLDYDALYVTKAYVDEGVTLKRWRPRAHGGADQRLRRTSHITIYVGIKE